MTRKAQWEIGKLNQGRRRKLSDVKEAWLHILDYINRNGELIWLGYKRLKDLDRSYRDSSLLINTIMLWWVITM